IYSFLPSSCLQKYSFHNDIFVGSNSIGAFDFGVYCSENTKFLKSDSSFVEKELSLKIDKRYSLSTSFFSPETEFIVIIGVSVSKYLFEKQL
ncbi:MAG: hypothetical protein ACK55Z_10405, partial [bacterium]